MSKRSGIWTFLIIVLFIVIIVLFVLSLGQLDTLDATPSNDFREKRKKARQKHKWYREVLKNQRKLKEDLDRKFKWVYFGVRVFLVIMWIGSISSFYFLGWAATPLELFGIASFPLWFIIGANYLTSGTYLDLKDFIEITKVKTENWVYGKYIDLNEKIDKNEGELLQLEKSIS